MPIGGKFWRILFISDPLKFFDPSFKMYTYNTYFIIVPVFFNPLWYLFDVNVLFILLFFCRSKIPASHPQILRKKEELISKISNKLEMLRGELTHLKAESKTNEEAGRQVTVKVMQVAQPNECEKYKLHVEEIDKITSLLLGLAARLARAENAFALCTDQSEKVRKKGKNL